MTHGVRARHDQLTNASGLSSVRCPSIHREIKKAPGLLPGLRDDCLGGTLDAPILSQGTNQARRGSHKRPDPPRLGKAGRDLPRRTRGDGARHDQLTNAALGGGAGVLRRGALISTK